MKNPGFIQTHESRRSNKKQDRMIRQRKGKIS